MPTQYAPFEAHGAWYIGRFGECRQERSAFPAGKGQPNDPTQPVTTLRTAWTKVRDKGKVVARWHDNRHTLVTELSESGAGDEVIMSAAEKAPGQEREEMASALLDLGGLYLEQKKFGEAEPVLKRAITIGETQGPEDAALVKPLTALAAAYLAGGKYPSGLSVLRRAAAIQEKLPPSSQDADLAETLDMTVDVMTKANRAQDAVELCQTSPCEGTPMTFSLNVAVVKSPPTSGGIGPVAVPRTDFIAGM